MPGTPRQIPLGFARARLSPRWRKRGASDWTTQRERPQFLTWMALSWQARPGVFERQLERRREFLEKEPAREKATLRAIRKEVGHRFHEAVWMVSLSIQQFQVELRWLRKLSREIHRRAGARYAACVGKDAE